jgi:hypothetical protein
MKKSIIITESQFSKVISKINEQSEPNLLYKTSYNPEDKSVLASYHLLSEKPNSFVVVNPKEFINRSRIWADNSADYKIGLEIVELPKSYVQIIGEIDDSPNYKIFKLPYWLFKKEPKLQIKRIEGEKRATLVNSEPILRKILDLGIMDAFESLGGDFKKIKTHIDRLKNPILPKKPDPSVYITGDTVNVGRTYWGD